MELYRYVISILLTKLLQVVLDHVVIFAMGSDKQLAFRKNLFQCFRIVYPHIGRRGALKNFHARYIVGSHLEELVEIHIASSETQGAISQCSLRSQGILFFQMLSTSRSGKGVGR